MTILNEITQDLDWRESEIASMKILLTSQRTTAKQKKALLRAAWAMLYAHYEGFSKNCLTLFFDEITRRSVPCGSLPRLTKAFALGSAIKNIRSMTTVNAIDEVSNFSHHLTSVPTFPDVDAKDNLWPFVLKDLLSSADLSTVVVEKHFNKLKTLVARRNSIAHGEANMIAEYSYYKGYEEAVYEVMYDLAFQVEARLTVEPYM